MQTLNLFDDMVVDAPETEGIKYAGSKLELLPHILQLVNKVSPKTVLGGFAGTSWVSQMLAQTGHRVIANDISGFGPKFSGHVTFSIRTPKNITSRSLTT